MHIKQSISLLRILSRALPGECNKLLTPLGPQTEADSRIAHTRTAFLNGDRKWGKAGLSRNYECG